MDSNSKERFWRNISLLLFVAFLILFGLYVVDIYLERIDDRNELTCSNVICAEQENIDAFIYDRDFNVCYCYSDTKIVYERKFCNLLPYLNIELY